MATDSPVTVLLMDAVATPVGTVNACSDEAKDSQDHQHSPNNTANVQVIWKTGHHQGSLQKAELGPQVLVPPSRVKYKHIISLAQNIPHSCLSLI